ncbi:hypothetical protein M0G43_06695 [Subsaxibacter sp. CAU 1640]|uniref:sensor histidine kinase n=1 Tax=Subsaxibacter sp. CAU 1640 TaxID=2933271 RepID=UPI002002D067|nr:ATP-binding protein [Subsaxibacter sp. CAU 1640]MCK7590253.1 hypothetical protein [Subsaxibacter sp. CAU 1640]
MCKSDDCRLKSSFKLSEYYLETDEIDKAQKWLDSTKKYHQFRNDEFFKIYIHSLQSELFYYIGLNQFGIYEADKAIEAAKKVQDSALLADSFFFRGINEFEMNDMNDSYKSLKQSKMVYPNLPPKKHLRTLIQKEHIHNNLAQLFLRTKQFDSAVLYNANAYRYAQKSNSKRGIPNCEQTFGLIYLAKNNIDSAFHYLQKSSKSALKSKYYDIQLINQGFLADAFKEYDDSVNLYFDNGNKIINNYPVNRSFRRHFFSTVLPLFKANGNSESLTYVQDQIIRLDSDVRSKGNMHVQNITEQYIKNENKLLNLEINKLKNQRKTSFLQIAALSLGVLVMLLFVILYKRKAKIQETLLYQKNEISKDLHDDIGSGLSSILIHADLLSKQPDVNDNQKLLLSKITLTGKDISQRMNAFIWSLNNENNNLRNFCEYLKQYASNLMEGTPIQLSFTQNIKEADHVSIDGHYRKQLFFCVKELLNNALKHSGATKIMISVLQNEKNQLQIIIKDNGVGLVKKNTFGNGLKNVEKRISEMQGKLNIIDEMGLNVKLSVVLK